MMIKMNKQRYFDVSFWYSRASWGVLGCLGVSWGNKTDPHQRDLIPIVIVLSLSMKSRFDTICEIVENSRIKRITPKLDAFYDLKICSIT